MPSPLQICSDRLIAQVAAARCVSLFSDFDGTLVPIRDRPDECSLDPAVARTLAALDATEHVQVSIVSGRELNDLRSRVGVEGIAYAGNHGLEIEGPGFRFREPNAVALAAAVNRLVQELAVAVADIPGAWVQPKGLSATVHYRQVQPPDEPLVIETVRRVSAAAVAAQQIILRPGKKVVEIRPSVNWDKGKAVRWMVERAPTPEPPLIIYFGDDTTDEDAFVECRDGITVVVGECPNSAAQYFVHSHEEVHWFLGQLVIAVKAPTHRKC